ncbi:MAG: PadR family transcriptional regulator [Gallionella sp.]|nr:PadR family transcriptional regulator [Gallionella sp.]
MVAISVKVVKLDKNRLTKKFRDRIIKNFLDVLVLKKLAEGEPQSGYDLISYFRSAKGVLLSSGTLYSLLYSLEHKGLVQGIWIERKRVYKLTELGLQTNNAIQENTDQIKLLFSTIIG